MQSWLVNCAQRRHSKFIKFDFEHIEFEAPVRYLGAIYIQDAVETWTLSETFRLKTQI